jgi:hypothetical protein
MATIKRAVLVFFNEVGPGDIKKWKRESHEAQTGGGAQDLRVPKDFSAKLARMFPKPGSKGGVKNAIGRPATRPFTYGVLQTCVLAQARIGRIYYIDSWEGMRLSTGALCFSLHSPAGLRALSFLKRGCREQIASLSFVRRAHGVLQSPARRSRNRIPLQL